MYFWNTLTLSQTFSCSFSFFYYALNWWAFYTLWLSIAPKNSVLRPGSWYQIYSFFEKCKKGPFSHFLFVKKCARAKLKLLLVSNVYYKGSHVSFFCIDWINRLVVCHRSGLIIYCSLQNEMWPLLPFGNGRPALNLARIYRTLKK